MRKLGLQIATEAVRAGYEPIRGDGLTPPIHLASTYHHPHDPEPGEFTYARGGSPGYDLLEAGLAAVEHGSDAVVFNAGNAVANAVFEELCAGDVLVLPFDAYYGIRVWAQSRLPERGVEVRMVDQTDLAAVEHSLAGARLFWTETPTNPLLAIADLTEINRLSQAAGVPWVCDNTFATPVLQRPLELGALGVMESLTKYVGGHSDLILGGLATNDLEFAARMRQRRSSNGTQPDGFSCWLARRGLQTLPLRVRAQSANALVIAKRLQQHEAVEQAFYPGLENHPGHEIAARQMDGGFGGMLSIMVRGGQAAAEQVPANCHLWVPATSLGGVESLIERRARWAGETAPPSLLRLSTGIEDVEDLWHDLDAALSRIA